MRAVALVLAAGDGVRLGAGMPKALVRLGGRTVLQRSAVALAAAPSVEAVLPVVSAGADAVLAELSADWRGPARLLDAVAGGASRQESVANGLRALESRAPEAEWVLVHDAARCLVEPADVEVVLAAARSTGAALPVVPVSDTLKELSGERVAGTPDRSRYARALTPQAFRVDVLRRALEQASRDGFAGTDCASLVERLGIPVAVCRGREANLKLTTPFDAVCMQALLDPGATSMRPSGPSATSLHAQEVEQRMRIGQGYDVHRLVAGRPLLLGGVEIPHDRGLEGHSDADVLAHAVGDALLGALGAGDLGAHFPSSDPEWKGASGARLLDVILARMRAAGLGIGNVDATVVAQEPRLAPHAERIAAGLASMLGVARARVNVKLKSTDRLGAIGRGEGIAAQAVVLLSESR